MRAELRKPQAALNALRLGRNACRAFWSPGLQADGRTIAVASTDVFVLHTDLPRPYVLVRAGSLLRRRSEGQSDGNLPMARRLLTKETATDQQSAAAQRHLVGG